MKFESSLDMNIVTGIAIYFIIWWLLLFIILPFRASSQLKQGHVVRGTDPAAPVNPQILKRILCNTIVSGFIFFLYWLVVYYFGFSVDSFPEFIPIRKIG
ncbi:DUF1467 family protein [Candidatus Endowatersipora endosymbiont of Watersipora subatra]|uniref:DUF1467 family protein n=1 Tax=Candidatus Endowatersipora endosymbiont of Watersipora subatra TaxID=3077946 RepID=UPI00312C7B9A